MNLTSNYLPSVVLQVKIRRWVKVVGQIGHEQVATPLLKKRFEMDEKLLYALKQEILKTIKNVYEDVEEVSLKRIFEEIIEMKKEK